MIHVYASHAISIEVLSMGNQEWKPEIYIRSVNDPNKVLKNLRSEPVFGTRAEAEQRALDLAKKWIDAGKPDTQQFT